jgi:hypothetical protein
LLVVFSDSFVYFNFEQLEIIADFIAFL